MLKTFLRSFFALIIFFISYSPSLATSYYVAGDTGLDTNDGSISTPWKTIQKAADTMIAGDTVNVRGGITYSDLGSANCNSKGKASVCITTPGGSGNPITYSNWIGTGIPIIDATGYANGINISASYVIISGFEVKNSRDDAQLTSAGILFKGAIANSIVKNSVIYNNHNFALGFAPFASGINDSSTVGPNYLYNNIVYDNDYGVIKANGTSTHIANNIIINNVVRGISMSDHTDQAIYNDVWNNTTNYNFTPPASNLSIDPQFIDYSSANLRLLKSSLLINAGTDLTASGVTSDILGVSRPQGSGYDISAYEYYDIPVTLTTTPTSPSNNTTPTIAGTASTIGAATISSTTYSVDSGSWSSTGVTGTSSFSIVVPALADGSHTIRVRATDSNGYVTDSTLYGSTTFTVDTTAPSTPDIDSPSGYTKDNTRPSLVYKTVSSVSSYSVSLDSGKNKSYQTSGIPSSGTGVWKDDNDVKVEFLSDSKVSVYFKGLNNSELTEGKHSWRVTSFDSAGNSASKSTDILLDRTAPSLSGFSIANLTSVTDKGSYTLPKSMITPEFTGSLEDLERGSEKTNDNGTKDTFDKVSSGLDHLTLTINQLQSNGTYLLKETKDYSLSDSTSDFYLKTQYPLLDGSYQLSLTGYDKAGNATSTTFTLTLGKPRSLPPIKKFIKDSLSTPKPELPPIIPSIIPSSSPTPTPSITPTSSPSLMSRILSFLENLFQK